jgi:peptidoglycan hydrolase-like protein with peptidoglycan-binding domain
MNSTRTKKLTAPAVILLLSAGLSAQTSQKPASHSVAKTHKVSHHGGKRSRKPRGQQAIDGERCRQIQAALVREHYMSGAPSGKWDDSTQAAMRRFQADQGWQSKSIPDSRALIRMGLGPDHEHLLNPESAMVAEPQIMRGSRVVMPVAARSSIPARAATSSPLPAQSSTQVAAPAATAPDLSSAH